MDNFEMQKQAQVLTDTRTPNQLARMYLEAREDLKEVEAILDKLEEVLPCDIDEILIDLELGE
jgi:hypothetical protein